MPPIQIYPCKKAKRTLSALANKDNSNIKKKQQHDPPQPKAKTPRGLKRAPRKTVPPPKITTKRHGASDAPRPTREPQPSGAVAAAAAMRSGDRRRRIGHRARTGGRAVVHSSAPRLPGPRRRTVSSRVEDPTSPGGAGRAQKSDRRTAAYRRCQPQWCPRTARIIVQPLFERLQLATPDFFSLAGTGEPTCSGVNGTAAVFLVG